jgi:chromosome segregation ATPase
MKRYIDHPWRDAEQRLQAEITGLRHVLEEVRQQGGTSRSRHLQASEQTELLRAQLEESRGRIAEQDAQLAALRQELEAVRFEGHDKQEHLRHALEILENQADTEKQARERELQAVRAQFEKDRVEFQEEAKRSHAEKEEWQQQVEAAQRELESLRHERDRLTSHGQQLEVSFQTAQEEAECLRKEVTAADRQHDALRCQVQALTGERDHLTTLQDQLDVSRREFEEQMQLEVARLTQVLEQRRHKEEATSGLYRELSEQMHALREVCEQERQHHGERQRRLAALEKELELARAEAFLEQERLRVAWTEEQSQAATERQVLAQELDAVRSEYSLRVSEINQLQAEAVALRADRETLKAGLSQAERLEQEGQRFAAELAQERHLRQSAEQRCQEAAAQVQQLEADLVEVSKDSESALALQKELEATRADYRAERKRIMQVLAEQQAAATTDRQKWQEELDTLRAHFEQERSSLQGEADRFRQEVATLEEERNATLQQIGALRQEWTVLASQREQLELALQERNRRYLEQTTLLTEEVERIRRDADGTVQHNQELQEELVRLRKDQGQHQNGHTVPPASATLEKEFGALKTEHDRLQTTLSEEQARAATERETLLKQMQEAENRFNQDRAALQSAAIWFRQEATHFRQILRNMGVHGL